MDRRHIRYVTRWWTRRITLILDEFRLHVYPARKGWELFNPRSGERRVFDWRTSAITNAELQLVALATLNRNS